MLGQWATPEIHTANMCKLFSTEAVASNFCMEHAFLRAINDPKTCRQIQIEHLANVSYSSSHEEILLNFEFSMFRKVAPQNIMYDRRVVRGNTFAALVIPVNMQPDPMSVEKQKKAAQARRNRLQKMKE